MAHSRAPSISKMLRARSPSEAVGDEALCLREQPAAGDFHRRSGRTAQCLPKLSGSKDGVAVEEQRPCGVGVGHALQRGGGAAVVEGGKIRYSYKKSGWGSDATSELPTEPGTYVQTAEIGGNYSCSKISRNITVK